MSHVHLLCAACAVARALHTQRTLPHNIRAALCRQHEIAVGPARSSTSMVLLSGGVGLASQLIAGSASRRTRSARIRGAFIPGRGSTGPSAFRFNAKDGQKRLHAGFSRIRTECSAASVQPATAAPGTLEDEIAAQLPFFSDTSRVAEEVQYSLCGRMLKREGKVKYLALMEHWRNTVPSTLGSDFKVRWAPDPLDQYSGSAALRSTRLCIRLLAAL